MFFSAGNDTQSFFFQETYKQRKTDVPCPPILKIVIRYSLFALMANLIYFLVNRIDYWFVEHYCSAEDLGNYIQASKLAQMLCNSSGNSWIHVVSYFFFSGEIRK